SGGASQAGAGTFGGAAKGGASTGGAAPTGGSAPVIPAEIRFEPPASAFEASTEVRLSALEPDAEIHYTVDGSLPNRDSPSYEGPIRIESSTRVRASAYLSGVDQPIAVLGATYLKVEEDARSFSTHLPIVVIHTFGSGQLDAMGMEHVPATLSVFAPNPDGKSWLGAAELDTPIGIHVRGQTSRSFPKKQYAVELRQEDSDDDRALSLLGMPADADWVLSDPVIMDRSLIRNAVSFEISNRIGRYAPRTRFAEAFLVDDGGSVTLAKYLGFYTVIEKIKRGRERVDIDKLEESETAPPDVTGGYIVSIDKGDPSFGIEGQPFQYVYPDRDVMNADARAPQREYIQGYLNANAAALLAADFTNPETGSHYSEYIDVDSFVDHNLINALTKNVDGLRISTFFYKDREQKLVAGPVWDFDRSLGTPYDARATDARGWYLEGSDGTDYFRQGPWLRLFEDPSFRARYKARFLSLLGSTLSPEELADLVDEIASRVGDAAQRDYDRWDLQPESGSHAAEITILKNFLLERAEWIHGELEAWE
ncbi:MAG: CotH kinase family protein, partial [Myxococcota bacterium]|nr:CotH kinase family protein [Myxococcota bacterium]